MHTSLRCAAAASVAGLAWVALAAQAADGLSVRDTAWPRWQTRILIGSSPATAPGADAQVVSASLLGDYYFSLPRLLPLTTQGGLRATSGVITNGGIGMPVARATLIGGDPIDAVPYVGLGYTRRAAHGGWGFTADIGVVAQNPSGAWRFGRALFGGPRQNLDDALRSLRLAPHVQLGVRYTF